MPTRAAKISTAKSREMTVKNFVSADKVIKEEFVNHSITKACLDNKTLGLPTYHRDDGGIYRLFPTGDKQYIRDMK
jgi:hypothetical protein